MVPVVVGPLLEGIEVGFVGLRPVGPPRFAIAAGAIALDVAQMFRQRLRAGIALIDQQGLDGHAPRHEGQLRTRETRHRVAASQARAGPLASALSVHASARTAHRRLTAAGLARLLEYLGNEALALALAPVRRGAGAAGNRRRGGRSWPRSPQAPACPVARSTRTCLHWRRPRAPRGTAAKPPCYVPHVQTGFRRGLVPCRCLAFRLCLRWRSGQRRPGGAAAGAASAPANARTDAMKAAGRARSRQDACTLDGCAEGSAKCGANAPALHARRHGGSHWNDMPDGTMRGTTTCSESAAIMGVSPARPDAQRRSRRMR